MQQMNRRDFVAAAVALWACACGMGTMSALADSSAGGAGATTGPTTLDAGPVENYKADGITTTWISAPYHIVLVRSGGRIYALTSVCTHRGATVKSLPDSTGFKCPRHHAEYDLHGSVIHGPAKRSLAHFGVSLDSQGHIIVDKTKTFSEAHWDEPGSYLKI